MLSFFDLFCFFKLGWCGHPIFSATGNYPDVMIERIANNSASEGRSWSRLPEFSKKWIDTIRGSADFIGLNYYTSRYVEIPTEPEGENPSYQRDMNVKETIRHDWKTTASSWLYSVPEGLGDILRCVCFIFNRKSYEIQYLFGNLFSNQMDQK